MNNLKYNYSNNNTTATIQTNMFTKPQSFGRNTFSLCVVKVIFLHDFIIQTLLLKYKFSYYTAQSYNAKLQ